MKTIERQIMQCFFYLLARDCVVPGEINRVLQEISKLGTKYGDKMEYPEKIIYTDKELANWASSKIREIECMF